MRDLDLFQQAPCLDEPWRVVATAFDPERRRLDLRLDSTCALTRPAP